MRYWCKARCYLIYQSFAFLELYTLRCIASPVSVSIFQYDVDTEITLAILFLNFTRFLPPRTYLKDDIPSLSLEIHLGR